MRWLVMVSLGIGLFLLLLHPVSAQEPTLRVTSPEEGAIIEGSTVTVTFEVEGFDILPSTVPASEAGQHPEANRPGEGHLHITLDQQTLVVWEREAPYVFTQVPAGKHVITVELADNDHAPLSPPVAQTINFTVGVPPGVMPVTGYAPPSETALLVILLGVAFIVATANRSRSMPDDIVNYPTGPL